MLSGLAGLAIVVATGVGAYRLMRHLRRGIPEPAAPEGLSRRAVLDSEEAVTRRIKPRTAGDAAWQQLVAKQHQSRLRLALWMLGLVANVLFVGRRGVGYRVMGLRLVDKRTGGKVSWMQAIIRVGTQTAWEVTTARLFPWPKVQPGPRVEELRVQMAEARREHADDHDALQRAMREIFETHRVEHPVRRIVRPLAWRLPLAVAPRVPALWSPLKQSVPDKLAGTVVVVDRSAR